MLCPDLSHSLLPLFIFFVLFSLFLWGFACAFRRDDDMQNGAIRGTKRQKSKSFWEQTWRLPLAYFSLIFEVSSKLFMFCSDLIYFVTSSVLTTWFNCEITHSRRITSLLHLSKSSRLFCCLVLCPIKAVGKCIAKDFAVFIFVYFFYQMTDISEWSGIKGNKSH